MSLSKRCLYVRLGLISQEFLQTMWQLRILPDNHIRFLPSVRWLAVRGLFDHHLHLLVRIWRRRSLHIRPARCQVNRDSFLVFPVILTTLLLWLGPMDTLLVCCRGYLFLQVEALLEADCVFNCSNYLIGFRTRWGWIGRLGSEVWWLHCLGHFNRRLTLGCRTFLKSALLTAMLGLRVLVALSTFAREGARHITRLLRQAILLSNGKFVGWLFAWCR